MIPRIIHQTWKTADVSTYADGNTGLISQRGWKQRYPDFEYRLWTDDDIEIFVQQEKAKAVHDALDRKIKRVDFSRYLILKKFGGIYADLDVISQDRLPMAAFDGRYDFIGYRAPRDHVPLQRQHPLTMERGTRDAWVLGQAFFATVPNHPALSDIIDYIKQTPSDRSRPLDHTGPERFHAIFVASGLLHHERTWVLSPAEMSNARGRYGFHLRLHQW
jgi:mannosyltransferase OCH1-like enzyme